MPYAKGKSGNYAGRPAGSRNKTTRQGREAMALFIDGNVHRLQGWLDAIAERDPLDAFKAFMSVLEFHVPKLRRSEVSGVEGMPPVKREFVMPLTLEEAAAQYKEICNS